ncbi:cytochrome C oxidase subunit IV family protein [Belnapia sp. T18]|uniref:Cytochrome bo(3) ubiquinol oxidase subunit 4 n=1 Tax=Belnapia arida TaxID=2804533 RepID=A0ABS1TZ79_9PROT|nr:cytochrome C oxidase subunit IV family protein [Belnapia arida]
MLAVCSLGLAGMTFIYGPGLPVALVVLAIAQIGIHLVFFLHVATAPHNTDNVMGSAFGMFIVFFVIAGSVWIMNHLNHDMRPM